MAPVTIREVIVGRVLLCKLIVRKIRQSKENRGLLKTLKLCAANLVYPLYEQLPARRRRRCVLEEFDRQFGVQTGGLEWLLDDGVGPARRKHGNGYDPTPPKVFSAMMKDVSIRHEEFVFIDYGSGKGRVLLLASDYPFQRIIGVEYSPQLHAKALENIEKYRSPTQLAHNLGSVCLDARDFPLPEEPAVFYFYNPFEEELMRVIIENIARAYLVRPRPMVVIYYNPVWAKLFESAKFLKTVKSGRRYAIYASPETRYHSK
jgi:hypothetical protein